MELHQSPIHDSGKSSSLDAANKTVTTFTFSRPVTNLSFTIVDIDAKKYDFVDSVAVTSASSYRWSRPNTTFLMGSGSTTDPWQPVGYENISDNRGNVTVTFASVTSFKLHYWNRESGYSPGIDGDQRIFLTDLTLTYDACS